MDRVSPLNPATHDPLGPEDLAPLFPMELIMQEVSAEPYIEIPEEVQEVYKLWRPSPLIRAKRLEKALDTPAKIYYKYEGVSPAGSHKPNTSVPQAYYNKKDGTKRLTTETGAGQWGSALSLATQLFGLECLVYMVRVSFDQKPYRKSMIKAWGADIIPSPSDTTEAGRAILAKDPETTGSLGMAISEAVEVAAKDDQAHYSLGSVLNHVMLHQTVIGQEVLAQTWARMHVMAKMFVSSRQNPLRARLGLRVYTPTTSGTPLCLPRCSRCIRWVTTLCLRASTPVVCATTAWVRWSPSLWKP